MSALILAISTRGFISAPFPAIPRSSQTLRRVIAAASPKPGYYCTLKHFPGLGRVVGDTHLQTADLHAPLAELERSDWIPFRAAMSDAGMVMLGHARLIALDPQRPVSFSHAVVDGLLRTTWRYDGVLVTDDFSMYA